MNEKKITSLFIERENINNEIRQYALGYAECYAGQLEAMPTGDGANELYWRIRQATFAIDTMFTQEFADLVYTLLEDILAGKDVYIQAIKKSRKHTTSVYAHAYTMEELSIPFDVCKLEGYTEYSGTEVYAIPLQYQYLITRPLTPIGYFSGSTIFTEE